MTLAKSFLFVAYKPSIELSMAQQSPYIIRACDVIQW